jgi:hypothetical protein
LNHRRWDCNTEFTESAENTEKREEGGRRRVAVEPRTGAGVPSNKFAARIGKSLTRLRRLERSTEKPHSVRNRTFTFTVKEKGISIPFSSLGETSFP